MRYNFGHLTFIVTCAWIKIKVTLAFQSKEQTELLKELQNWLTQNRVILNYR